MEEKNGEGINLQIMEVGGGNKTKDTPVGTPTSQNEDYDPHQHRSNPNATTNRETLIHLLKGSLGTGILAMPEAFHNSGLVLGTISTILIGALCTYCLHVLVQAQYILCKKLKVPVLSYPASMKYALEIGPQCLRRFANASYAIVDIFLIVYQVGICCVYVVFVAENIKQLIDFYVVELDVKLHMVFLLIPLIAINSIRNLKLLAPFSSLANLVTLVGICLIMVYILDDLPSPSTREMVAPLVRYPLFFGTTLFALEAVGVIIALENNMKTPASFGGYCGVLNVAMSIIVFLYVMVGFLGYIKYGPDSKGSITLNLPNEEIMAQSIKIMFTLAIYVSYGLQCYVPVEILLTRYFEKKIAQSDHKILYEYAIRIGVVIVTFLSAVAIPRLGLFISLIGVFCLSALGLAFPAVIELCAKWPDNLGKFRYVLVKDIALVLFGIVALIVGTYVSVRGIVLSFM